MARSATLQVTDQCAVIGGLISCAIPLPRSGTSFPSAPLNVTSGPVTYTAIEQFRIKLEEEQANDLIRDIAVTHHAVIRGMRTWARSLEDIYLGSVGTAPEVTRVD